MWKEVVCIFEGGWMDGGSSHESTEISDARRVNATATGST